MFGSIYIVNSEIDISDLKFNSEGGFESVSINFNDTPINASKGLIVGPDYQDFVHKKSNT